LRKILVSILAVGGLALSAGIAAAANITVGVSWNNHQEERWGKWDEPAIKAVLDKAGAKYISTDAQSSAEKQASDIENLISQGANAIIILAQDQDAILPAVKKAQDAGIPVIAYDRLFENPSAFYITFDNKGVGSLMAKAIFAAVPKGNYAIIKGNSADPNADFLRAGIEEVIGKAVKSGAIKIVGETYTDNWATENAQKEMEQILTANANKVDAVISENDGMATGVAAALAAQGLLGKVPLSGQDGDLAALNRVALGQQTVSIWKDARELGKVAAETALALASGKAPAKIKGAVKFSGGPKKVEMNAIFLTPTPITKANLGDVIKAGWIAKDVACKGVTGGVKACM